MKAVLCSILALLQVLICTMGQGALTLCVRQDGTQQLEWTRATFCADSKTEGVCHCGCGDEEKSCPDEMPSQTTSSSAISKTCNSCTDTVLLVEQPSVSIEKNQSQSFSERHFLNQDLLVELNSLEFAATQQCGTDPPFHIAKSFAANGSSVVIRC